MALWLVRSGPRGERETFALQNKVVVIGWDEVPDLSQFASREALLNQLEKVYPDKGKRTLITWLNQLWAFAKEIEEGDLVAMPSKAESVVHFGKVIGPYRYISNNPEGTKHQRPVEWLTAIPRKELDKDLLYSLGAYLTVARIQRNRAEERVRALLEGKKLLPPIPPEELDLETLARDQIREYLARHFKGHELARLVEGILQAQGYRTFLSPPGRDGGVDILAGSGPLGFESPRIAVQIKSGDSPIGTKELNELRGAMTKFKADYGLFVSWGGFKDTVRNERAQGYFEIRLWNSDDLISHLLESYERLPEDLKAELPFKRIWVVVETEKENP
jgi:restriction system protein